jgi:hypothetical protein
MSMILFAVVLGVTLVQFHGEKTYGQQGGES